MSISASQIELMRDGGLTLGEIVEVARAMERGRNHQAVSVLMDTMAGQNYPKTAVARCTLALARDIIEQDRIASERFCARLTDEFRGAKDSNRARRNMPDTKWRALRLEVFERDGHACQYCGDGDDLTCDHIIPLVRGGTNDLDNLATACRACNSSKGDKLFPEEWTGRDIFQ